MTSKFLFYFGRSLLSLMMLGLLQACATAPEFDTTQVDKSLTPQSVIAESALSRNKMVLWGGTIIDTRNLKDNTRIEMLAYPLDSRQRPLLDKKPLGRFLIQQVGYLEPASYAQGRQLTVLGSVGKNQSGKIGESQYTYAVINAKQLHLWSKEDDRNRSSFHFGIGISR